MQANKALLLSAMLSSSENVENAEIATFDASCVSTPDIIVNLEPIQDLHGYDNPWPAGGGKNKFNPDSTDDIWVGLNGSISHFSYTKSCTLPTTAGTTWTLSDSNSSSATNILLLSFFDSSNAFLSRHPVSSGAKFVTATAPTDTAYMIASCYHWEEAQNAQLELGSTATSYSPYSNLCPISGRSKVNVYVEETYDAQATPKATIQLGQTVYGGTLDVTEGKLTITHASQTFSGSESETWVDRSSGTQKEFSIPAMYLDETAISSSYKVEPVAGGWTTLNPFVIGYTTSNRSAFRILYDGTVESWKSYLQSNPFTLVYKLATPVEVTLTPQQIQTMVGTNNIWSDGGNVSVLNITCNADFLETFLKMKLIGDC